MNVVKKVEFEACGTFGAISEARKYLEEKGFRIGSMCGDEPIGFAPSSEYNYIAKWYNIKRDEHKFLTGVIKSDDFREGGVVIEYWK